MNRWVRVVVAMTGAAALAAGCGNGSISQSRSDTTTSVPAGQSVKAAEIDSLVTPIEQVPGGLHNNVVEKQPQPNPPDSSHTCHAAYTGLGDTAPNAFRKVYYSGLGNLYVVQTIGVYADPSAADAVFHHLTDELSRCKAKGNGVSVDSIAPARAVWHVRGFSPVKGAEETLFATDARTAKNVVFSVTAEHFDNAQQSAASVADRIAAKIDGSR